MNLIDVPPKAGLQLNHYLAFPYFSIINVYFGLGLWLPFWHVPLLVSLSHKFHRQTESTCDRVYISTKHVCMYVASELCERKQNHWRFESLATFTNLNLDFFAEILNFGFSTWNFLPQQFLLNPKVNIPVCFSLYAFKWLLA